MGFKRMEFIKSIMACFMLAFMSSSAHAVEKEAFTQERFDQLQEAGEVVLVEVFASWCTTCAKQQVAIEKYRSDNPEKSFTILEIDYDDQKALVRQFRAPRQSTLLIYRGDEQFWFSVAETRPEVIAAELDKAIDYVARY